MDTYKLIKRIADNLLMLEDFSILNAAAKVEQITSFITRTCAGIVDIDAGLVKDAVSAAVQDDEISCVMFPELLEEEGYTSHFAEQHRERRTNRYRRQREIAQAIEDTSTNPYEELKF